MSVDGQRVAVETKPLELLRELLVHAGNLVSKDQLMDAVWPDVEVVEASLPTAVGKLRRALHDDRRDKPIIETIPRIGYRLAVPVEVEELADEAGAAVGASQPAAGGREAGAALDTASGRRGPSRPARVLAIGGGLALATAALVWGFAPSRQAPPTKTPFSFSQRDIFVALRKMDVDRIDRMVASGWDPNVSLDSDRNSALDVLVNNCEWDPGHDKRRMLLLARTLLDGGQRLTDRNAWGDTPYSIASARRYCGPDHPVTVMIRKLCSSGGYLDASSCLADYHRDKSGTIIRQ